MCGCVFAGACMCVCIHACVSWIFDLHWCWQPPKHIKRKVSVRPAVEVPHPGASVNPAYDDHQVGITFFSLQTLMLIMFSTKMDTAAKPNVFLSLYFSVWLFPPPPPPLPSMMLRGL